MEKAILDSTTQLFVLSTLVLSLGWEMGFVNLQKFIMAIKY
jgi:hypothetical protein